MKVINDYTELLQYIEEKYKHGMGYSYIEKDGGIEYTFKNSLNEEEKVFYIEQSE
jgi:hypothetical protein